MTRHSGDYNLKLCCVLTPDPDPVFRSWPGIDNPDLPLTGCRSREAEHYSPKRKTGRISQCPEKAPILRDSGLVSIVSFNSIDLKEGEGRRP